MKSPITSGAILLVIVNGLLLIPASAGHTILIAALALALALFVLWSSLASGKSRAEPVVSAPPATSRPLPVSIPPPAPTTHQAESEIVAFFGLLQEKGRLVDFLMEDVASYEDAEVGAAARVLQEYFQISPISEAQEGSQVTVPAGYSPDQYRLVGKLAGEPPFTGTLLHKGWKTDFVKLPRVVKMDRLPAIAPAEIELA
jgi:hypothetical protein